MNRFNKCVRTGIVVLGVAAGTALSTGSVGAAYPTNTSVAVPATQALPLAARIPAMCLDDGPHLEGGILEWALTTGIKDSRHYWYHQRALADAYWAHYACPDAR
jgi:hypothetical protein